MPSAGHRESVVKVIFIAAIAASMFVMGMMSVHIAVNTGRIADALEIIASPPEG